MRKPFPLLAAALLAALPAAADVKLPQPSPAASVRQTVGVTTIEVNYHRPGVKGRAIWGALVPYGQVWRLGANEATTISFSDPVKVEGHDLAAGTYALFAVPSADKWTFIFDKTAEQWGAYSRKDADDVLRFDAKPQAAGPTEWMQFTVTPSGTAGTAAVVAVEWEKLRVAFNVEVDTPKLAWAQIDAALAAAKPADGATYRLAARYALDNNVRLTEAVGWLDKASAAGESYSNYDLKSQLLAKQGKTAEAIPVLQKAIDLARASKASQDAIGNLEKRLAEWKAKK